MSTPKTDMRTGFRAIGRGFWFLKNHPGLIRLAIIPFVIQLVLLAVALTYFFAHTTAIVDWLTGFIGSGPTTDPTFFGKLTAALWWIVHKVVYLLVIVIVIGLLLTLFLAFLAGGIIAAPLNDRLAERAEELATGVPSPPFAWHTVGKGLVRSIRVEVQKAILFIGIPVFLLLLHLIPIVGSICYLICTTGFGLWATGFGFLDYPMGRRLLPFRMRLGFAWRHARAATGLGVVFCIPGFCVFFNAPLIVAGTLLYLELNDRALVR